MCGELEGSIIVNQISDAEICPDERSEEGSLFTRDEACLPQIEKKVGDTRFDLLAAIIAFVSVGVFSQNFRV